jgi:hypothetical protein
MRPPTVTLRRRRIGLAALVLAVLALHLVAMSRLAAALPRGAEGPASITRLEIGFTQALAPAEPARPPAAKPPAPARSRAVASPALPASAPAAEEAAPPAVEAVEALAAAPVTTPEPAAVAAVAAAPSAPASGAAAVADTGAAAETAREATPPGAAEGFEWPLSTRLDYRLVGDYRGPVHGQARVEWLKAGPRYQVHLDVSVGPSLAPFMARRMSSEGLVGAGGLVPRRFEESTRIGLAEPRRLVILFDEGFVRLPAGRVLARPAGVQDSASQFVQLTWMLHTGRMRAAVGEAVELPLALPRRVDAWHYEIVGAERIATPLGELDTLHVKPRREGLAGELTAEAWFAPALQHLPVRIRIRQGREAWVELTLDTPPMQEAAPASEAPRR